MLKELQREVEIQDIRSRLKTCVGVKLRYGIYYISRKNTKNDLYPQGIRVICQGGQNGHNLFYSLICSLLFISAWIKTRMEKCFVGGQVIWVYKI